MDLYATEEQKKEKCPKCGCTMMEVFSYFDNYNIMACVYMGCGGTGSITKREVIK